MSSLNDSEKERLLLSPKNTMQFYLRNFDQDESIHRLVKKVLGKDANSKFIEDQRIPSQFVIRNGLCYNADFSSEYVNVVNGRRVTTEGAGDSCGEVYMFGPCTMFGMIVEDRYTIPSCFQRIINNNKLSVDVVNEGLVGAPIMEAIRKFNRSEYRKNSFFVFLVKPDEEASMVREFLPNCRLVPLDKCFESFDFHDYFFDRPWHCNKQACSTVAQYMFEMLEDDAARINNYSNVDIIPAILSNSGVNREEFSSYLNILRQYRVDGKNGAIVMNCNPFTNGHLYLIQEASRLVEHLYLFVVSEDKSYFTFEDRMRLVKEGVRGRIQNAIVIPSGKLVISSDTFPEYFFKESVPKDVYIDASLDLEIFARHIAPILNISVRFVGEEPFDVVTQQYNRDMKRILPKCGISVVEIPRKKVDDKAISASSVRKLLAERKFEEIKPLVPETTFRYLMYRFQDI